jgi:hypothetical protein
MKNAANVSSGDEELEGIGFLRWLGKVEDEGMKDPPHCGLAEALPA